jgi:hypothetical protein
MHPLQGKLFADCLHVSHCFIVSLIPQEAVPSVANLPMC